MAVITDDFARADADALGTAAGGWSWTETSGDADISSGTVICGGADDTAADARAETDLSGAPQYAQVDVITLSTGSSAAAISVIVQFSASARDYYTFYVRGDTSNYRLFRSDAGTYTQIGTTLTEAIPARPFTARIEIDGSGNITGKIDGTTKRTGTDTTHAANRRTGILVNKRTGLGSSAVDNFEAGDVTTVNPYGYRPLYFHGVGA